MCFFSVNSYLAIVYDRLPHNIVFHQKLITVLFLEPKNCFGGRDRMKVIYPTISATVWITVLQYWMKLHFIQIGRSGNLFGVREALFLFSLFIVICKHRNKLLKGVFFLQLCRLYFEPKHIDYCLILTQIILVFQVLFFCFFHGC